MLVNPSDAPMPVLGGKNPEVLVLHQLLTGILVIFWDLFYLFIKFNLRLLKAYT